MKLKKPKFWDYKYISFLAIVLSPLSFFVNIFNYIKLKISKKKNFRASILDKEGNILAKSVPVVNLGINPNLVINKEKLLISLKILFPKKNFKKQMYRKKFFYLKKKIHPEKLEQILLLGEKSFIQEDSIARVYPNGNLFSHVIGQIDKDNNGISGLEKTFDYELRTSRDPLKLTLDTDLQYLIREELIKSENIFQNIDVKNHGKQIVESLKKLD